MIDGDAALALVCHRNHRMSFVFEAAQTAGIRLVLIYDSSESEPPHGLPGVVGYWRLPVFEDPDAALKEFVDGAGTRGLGGVMTLREEAIIWTAEAARRLGTPGIPPAVAALVRNKYRMRQALAQAGLRTPTFAHINDPGDISSVESLGFPLVIKPLAGWGSAGVMLARSVEELHERIRTVWAMQERDLSRFYEKTDTPGLVVEQYLPGKEFVAECFVDGDGVHVMAVGDKGHPQGPWFEETIYRLREDLDSVQVMALREAACAGVKALGITMGAAHVEMRLDAEGLPYVIEIGARIGGSGVSHFIVEQGTGGLLGRAMHVASIRAAHVTTAGCIACTEGFGQLHHPITGRRTVLWIYRNGCSAAASGDRTGADVLRAGAYRAASAGFWRLSGIHFLCTSIPSSSPSLSSLVG